MKLDKKMIAIVIIIILVLLVLALNYSGMVTLW